MRKWRDLMSRRIDIIALRKKYENVPFGKKPDPAVAIDLNMDRRKVCYIRRYLGIPAFKGLIITQEGLPCRSIYEAMFDCYLHWKRIKHEHEVNVDLLPYVADFKISNKYFEIFGMFGFKKYEDRKNEKIKAYKENNIFYKSISITTIEKLYKICPVKVIFNIERKCQVCGKETYNIIKNLCKNCYMKSYHRSAIIISTCKICKEPIQGDYKKEYCGYECYWESLRTNKLPPDNELLEILKNKSIRKLGKELGVSPSSISSRAKRARNKSHIHPSK